MVSYQHGYVMDLGVLEQSPRLRTIYTQLCFCYPTENTIEREPVIDKLTRGLKKLTAKLPWVAGQIVSTMREGSTAGRFQIVPFKKLPTLIAKDMIQDGSLPSLQALRKASYPFGLLDEQTLCPRTTLSERPNETSSDPYPVLLLQANFFRDGLLLTIQACHSAMDIVGQVQIIQLLSKACNDEDLTVEEVEQGNLDRRDLIPLLDQTDKPETTRSAPQTGAQDSLDRSTSGLQTSTPTYRWAYFTFNSTDLSRLKMATESNAPPDCPFVSTDDSLCAILWQSIGRARLARLSPSAYTTFVRQVDMRSHMNLSPAFAGNMVVSTNSKMTLHDLVHAPLGVVAAQLRSELQAPELKHALQLNATSAAKPKDKSSEPSKDRSQLVVMSSWSKASCYNVDFGLGLGKPDCVRRPRFSPIEGVIYLLPKTPDGEIAAGLCLRADDMSMMEADQQLLGYARYIG